MSDLRQPLSVPTAESRPPSARGQGPSPFVTVTVIVGAAMMLVFGVWCRVDPNGFAQWANWPEHEHFLHDAGVFQIGIGLMLLSALWWRDAVAVGLAGLAVTNALHAWNHWADLADGGRPSDPYALLAVAVLAVVALVVRLRTRSRRR